MLNIIKDKEPIWETDKYDVILVGTSIYCMLTNGFQSKMRLKYPYIDAINDSTNYGDSRKLGKRMTIQGKPIISLMYIANYPHRKRVFVDYDALEHAMATANAEFKGKKGSNAINEPRINDEIVGCESVRLIYASVRARTSHIISSDEGNKCIVMLKKKK